MVKNKLAFSELTQNVYWVDGRGRKTTVTDNFVQVMLLFLNDGQQIEYGQAFGKDIELIGGTTCEIKFKFSKKPNVQECDASKADKSVEAGNQKP